MTLKALAEAGIFNLPDQTPMSSAEQAPLYDAMLYLSASAAESEYERNLMRVQQEEQRKK